MESKALLHNSLIVPIRERSNHRLMNVYAMMKTRPRIWPPKISLLTSLPQGASSDNFSNGWPSFFFLYPLSRVHERRQYPIHKLSCNHELPQDIHPRNSLRFMSLSENLIGNTKKKAHTSVRLVFCLEWSSIQVAEQLLNKSSELQQVPEVATVAHSSHNASLVFSTFPHPITWLRPSQGYQPPPQKRKWLQSWLTWLTHNSLYDSLTTHPWLTHNSSMSQLDTGLLLFFPDVVVF